MGCDRQGCWEIRWGAASGQGSQCKSQGWSMLEILWHLIGHIGSRTGGIARGICWLGHFWHRDLISLLVRDSRDIVGRYPVEQTRFLPASRIVLHYPKWWLCWYCSLWICKHCMRGRDLAAHGRRVEWWQFQLFGTCGPVIWWWCWMLTWLLMIFANSIIAFLQRNRLSCLCPPLPQNLSLIPL